MSEELFEQLYIKTVAPNFQELSFFWSYPYSDEFVANEVLDVDEMETELEGVKKFGKVSKAVQYAFYVWCKEHNKL